MMLHAMKEGLDHRHTEAALLREQQEDEARQQREPDCRKGAKFGSSDPSGDVLGRLQAR